VELPRAADVKPYCDGGRESRGEATVEGEPKESEEANCETSEAGLGLYCGA